MFVFEQPDVKNPTIPFLVLTDMVSCPKLAVMKQGKLIVFEGIDGSGKTTQSRALQEYIKTSGLPCHWFREPGDSPAGRRIRDLAMNDEYLSPEEELALFVSDRKDNVLHNILPHLNNGSIVILDRYYFSSACYQGARGLDVGTILRDHESFAPKPDLALYIDIDIETAMERIRKNRSQRAMRFEIEDFLRQVRMHYLELCRQEILMKIDGKREKDLVWEDIRRPVAALLQRIR